ncbi:hypothetical protein L484_001237 [Morus notabilis]|uniref:Uncharacterized protein n=1 Tax=Morus notabilis TaxID=981085 RepID=W9RIW2_9ROSA|nr:hypothetical protein L484_001237 [Morus notabilis]
MKKLRFQICEKHQIGVCLICAIPYRKSYGQPGEILVADRGFDFVALRSGVTTTY